RSSLRPSLAALPAGEPPVCARSFGRALRRRSVRSAPRAPASPRASVSASANVRAMDDEVYRRGRERFLEIHDEKALRTVEGLGELGRYIVEFVYGEMYTKPALSDRDRELGAVVALTSLGRSSQLPQHLRASL